jgi:PilZ domain
VPDPCVVVIIAPPNLIESLTQRAGPLNGEVLAFSDAEPLRALETIAKRKPQVVALERLFAVTPRGAALINRIKADPKLNDAEIRVLAHDSDYSRVVPRAAAPPPPSLDQPGTRRAPRLKMKEHTTATIDGKRARIVDLSIIGAQVISASGLKPNQSVAMVLSDHAGTVRFTATVAWTSFEIPADGGPCYRAGINFADADPVDVDAFCVRHKV